jgi:hypothetical protein
VLHIFIRNFSCIARLLINLTKKDVPFEFGGEHREAVQTLKDSILESPALRRLDYECDHEVILAVDTSVVTVGFILLQLGEDGKCYPNCFGSIALSEVESCYSQAKLELYGLFRALCAVCVYIFGITNLMVEVDTKYIKGMINNPDLQPNMTINRWIVGILLFQFNLVHVPAAKHAGIDGLSRRPPAENNPEEDDDHEDWVDRTYLFGVTLLNERMHQVDAAGTQIMRTVHNAPYVRHLVRLPDMRVFLDIIDAN